MAAPSAGGALLPNQDQKINANVEITGNLTVDGKITQSGSTGTLTDPLIKNGLTASGTVANDFSGSSGAFKTSTGANQLSGAVSVTDATTPSVTTATGKTNTGFVTVLGKTSGGLKITTADATAQTVTVTAAAQTTGASTLTIPDQAGVSSSFVLTTLAQTLTNKTLTAPVLGVATGTSLATSGLITSSSPSAGIGYATGAGGAVTQSTSKATAVTASPNPSLSGAITLNNAALAAATIVSFVFTNSGIAATDVLILNHISGGTIGSYTLNAQAAAGSATINIRNNTAGSLSEAVVIQYAVIKAVNA